MIAATANSVSVAEAGIFLMMSLARRGAAMDTMVKEGRWRDRYNEMPVDMYGKTVLVVGFGKIGSPPAPPPPPRGTDGRRYRPPNHFPPRPAVAPQPAAAPAPAARRARVY